MSMPYSEFVSKYNRILEQETISKIFNGVRDSNIEELQEVMASDDEVRINELQSRLNATVQRDLTDLSEKEGIQFRFDEVWFSPDVDFYFEVALEPLFFPEIPPENMPA